MGNYHNCAWTQPIINGAERFAEWSRDVRKLLDNFPAYVTSARNYHMKVAKIPLPGVRIPICPWKLEDYDEQRHDASQYFHFLFKVCDEIPIDIIRGPEGTGDPIITETEVSFNADGSEGWYGFFSLTLEQLIYGDENTHKGYLFWKTPGNAHDFLVQAALVRLAHFFPELHIHSDEGAIYGMWEGAILCKEIFGFGVDPNTIGA